MGRGARSDRAGDEARSDHDGGVNADAIDALQARRRRSVHNKIISDIMKPAGDITEEYRNSASRI